MKRVLAALLLLASPAFAQPPAGQHIDPKIHAWFESLVRADGAPCCSEADCRIADQGQVRIVKQHFEVLINGLWQRVPPELVVHRDDNPLGVTVICMSRLWRSDHVPDRLFCVVPYLGI